MGLIVECIDERTESMAIVSAILLEEAGLSFIEWQNNGGETTDFPLKATKDAPTFVTLLVTFREPSVKKVR